MTGTKAMRWITTLATVVLLVAIAIGTALVVAWTSMPLDRATLVIDGETLTLPSLSSGQLALVLVLAVLAVLVAAIVVVGAVAIAFASALCGLAGSALVVVVTLLLLASPILLIGWLIWRLTRSPPAGGPQPRLA